jgi:hypothetical protein
MLGNRTTSLCLFGMELYLLSTLVGGNLYQVRIWLITAACRRGIINS